MQTITLIEGVTLTATQSTIDAYLKETREIQRRREAIEWLKRHDASDELYSDVYKDVYGVRPRY